MFKLRTTTNSSKKNSKHLLKLQSGREVSCITTANEMIFVAINCQPERSEVQNTLC